MKTQLSFTQILDSTYQKLQKLYITISLCANSNPEC